MWTSGRATCGEHQSPEGPCGTPIWPSRWHLRIREGKCSTMCSVKGIPGVLWPQEAVEELCVFLWCHHFSLSRGFIASPAHVRYEKCIAFQRTKLSLVRSDGRDLCFHLPTWQMFWAFYCNQSKRGVINYLPPCWPKWAAKSSGTFPDKDEINCELCNALLSFSGLLAGNIYMYAIRLHSVPHICN